MTAAALELEERRENCLTSAAASIFDSLLLFSSATTYWIKSIMTLLASLYLGSGWWMGLNGRACAIPLHEDFQELDCLGCFHRVIADLVDNVFDRFHVSIDFDL